MSDYLVTGLEWAASFRLVPSRFPPIHLFETVADSADLEAVFAIERMGNPRLRDQVGQLMLVPPEDRISGQGTSPIMAAFTHLNPEGSRFSDGSYGVYYAADQQETAIAEVAHHRARFLAATQEPPIEIDLRCYKVGVQAQLCDIRRDHRDLHDQASYAASQAFALARRQEGRAGIVYDSVRKPGAECVALFTPKATVPPAIQSAHITLCWNGESISDWYVKSDHHRLSTR
jgi:RES domain-containing protein